MKEHFLTLLRQQETDTVAFRSAANSLALFIAQDIARDMPLQPQQIQTPIAVTSSKAFNQTVVLVPILRAGLVMLPAFLNIFQQASIGFLGIQRDKLDARPHLYYENIPQLTPDTYVFLLDPMLATGGTANLAIDKLSEKGASLKRICLATFLSAKPGIDAVQSRHPQIKIHTAAVDNELNSKKFIVPGLGDFGNRYFGT